MIGVARDGLRDRSGPWANAHLLTTRFESCPHRGGGSAWVGMRGQPVSPPRRRSTRGSAARREGGDVAGRWRRSTTTMPRGKPRAGPHRAGPARARRRVARRTVRPHRGPGARGTRRRGLADRQGAAAQSSMPTRRSSGRPRGGCAPAGNGGRGRCRSVAVLTERGGRYLGVVQCHGGFFSRWGTTHASGATARSTASEETAHGVHAPAGDVLAERPDWQALRRLGRW